MAEDRKDLIEQHDSRRRRARDSILDAIQGDDEVTNKTVLRLLLTVVEEIGDKIDTILNDERSLRETVLNGHTETHHADHDWTKERREEKCEEVCRWARGKMEAEAQADKDAKEIAKAGKKAAVEQFSRMAVVGLIGLMSGLTAALAVLK